MIFSSNNDANHALVIQSSSHPVIEMFNYKDIQLLKYLAIQISNYQVTNLVIKTFSY